MTAGGVSLVTTVLPHARRAAAARRCFLSSFSTDVLDKSLVFALIAVVLRSLPRQMAVRFPALAR